jgi:two-component system cell cycle response regulator DivK
MGWGGIVTGILDAETGDNVPGLKGGKMLSKFQMAVTRPMDELRSVLIVEDDPHTLSGYLELLTSAGFEPSGASTGPEALKTALERPPCVIVTDITLPGMSGFSLAEALRFDERTRNVPVIGLTAHWTLDVRTRASDVGMRAVLLKPCVPAHLIAELERVLGAERSTRV